MMAKQKKSSWPDMNEIVDMTTTFLKDMKKSVCGIVKDYKAKRGSSGTEKKKSAASATKSSSTKKTAGKDKS